MEIDFQKLMSEKSNEDIQKYLDDYKRYTPEAIEAAVQELIKRGRSFSDSELQSVRSRIEEQKIEFEKSLKTRHYYWWGILGLIPLVGAIVGIVLILFGIFRYKDKLLVVVGAGCVLFTMAVYSYLFFKLPKDDGHGVAVLSQIQINDLVKNIEFFKIQNGSYPRSLDELVETDKLAPVIDPLLLSKSVSQELYFKYEIVGTGYNLHSVGDDNVDKTEDDIYPNLSNTGEIGYITKEKAEK